MLFSLGKNELGAVATKYHAFNLLLSVLFIVSKVTPGLCNMLYAKDDVREEACGIESRERDILLFLLVVIAVKGRKATNWLHYVNNIFLYSKIASFFLFCRADPLLGIVYLAICLVSTVLFPQPVYDGPESVTYYHGDQLFNQLVNDKKSVYVVQFFTTWSGECKHVAPVFAKLSHRFALPNLRFGKLDVSRFQAEGERFRVSSHPMSRQLPTICVFRDGKEIARRPLVNENRRAVPFVFTEENCITAFDLLNLHNEFSSSRGRHEDPKKKEN